MGFWPAHVFVTSIVYMLPQWGVGMGEGRPCLYSSSTSLAALQDDLRCGAAVCIAVLQLDCGRT